MSYEKKLLTKWLDSIPDSKLDMRFYDKEVTIKANYQINNDKSEAPWIHRLYIQPVGNTSQASRTGRDHSTNYVVCRCHATDTATADEIREAIIRSFVSRKANGDEALCGYAPPKNE
ncbi:hypothetical protein V8F20_001495 [Naviculisporaceae sp. PSN 640]